MIFVIIDFILVVPRRDLIPTSHSHSFPASRAPADLLARTILGRSWMAVEKRAPQEVVAEWIE